MQGKHTITLTNAVFAMLPPQEQARLLPMLELVTLHSGDVLYENEDVVEYVYFPVSAIIVLVKNLENNFAMGVAMVGHDGVVGLSIALGEDKLSRYATFVLMGGDVLRMKAECFKREFKNTVLFQQSVLQYVHEHINQITKMAACNHFHFVGSRLARCLLMTHDRVQLDTFPLTHKFMALLLGVRRERVTQAAQTLQNKNIIKYARGKVHILERSLLEAEVCHCYQPLKINKIIS